MDKFYEQFLFTKRNSSYVIYNILFYAAAVLAFIFLSGAITLLNLKIFIVAALMGAACYGSYRMKEKSYQEFEYTFTNGNFEIDVIYSKKKRKKIFDEDVKNFEDFGGADQLNPGREFKQNVCIPWDNKEKRYVILSAGNGKQAYYIAPDENMIKLIQSYFIRRPRRF